MSRLAEGRLLWQGQSETPFPGTACTSTARSEGTSHEAPLQRTRMGAAFLSVDSILVDQEKVLFVGITGIGTNDLLENRLTTGYSVNRPQTSATTRSSFPGFLDG